MSPGKYGRIAGFGRQGRVFIEAYLDSGDTVELSGPALIALRAHDLTQEILFVERRGLAFSFVQWLGSAGEAVDALGVGLLLPPEVPSEVVAWGKEERLAELKAFQACIPESGLDQASEPPPNQIPVLVEGDKVFRRALSRNIVAGDARAGLAAAAATASIAAFVERIAAISGAGWINILATDKGMHSFGRIRPEDAVRHLRSIVGRDQAEDIARIVRMLAQGCMSVADDAMLTGVMELAESDPHGAWQCSQALEQLLSGGHRMMLGATFSLALPNLPERIRDALYAPFEAIVPRSSLPA